MICRPPRIRAVRATDALTLYEERLMQSAHPRSALAKRARKARRLLVWLRAELEDAVPVAVDDEPTAPYTVD